MRLDFDDETPGTRPDAFESRGRIEWRQREKIISEIVALRQQPVHEAAVEAVEQALLAALEREAAPHDRARREQPAEQDVGAQVHVVMSVDSFWRRPVQAIKLIALRSDQISERPREPGMVHRLPETLAEEVARDRALALP